MHDDAPVKLTVTEGARFSGVGDVGAGCAGSWGAVGAGEDEPHAALQATTAAISRRGIVVFGDAGGTAAT
jgi:hypothetical protein